MNGRSISSAGLGLALLLPSFAQGADDAELLRIRAEIRELRESYEARIRALERRLEQVQAPLPAATGAPAPAPATAVVAGTSPPALRARTGESAFNPAISLILSGRYARTTQDPAAYAITGFPLPSGAEAGPVERGLSLGESELTIGASVDPYLRGVLSVALAPDDGVAVEEANIQTTSLSQGFTVKAGRFLSGIGYLNEQHPHVWDFVDAPLAYQAFLGRQFGDDGVQLRWVAPTDTFVELGVEAGRGRSFPAAGSGGNGAGAFALHGHVGGDVGDSHGWRAGVSVLRASPRDQRVDAIDRFGDAVVNGFSGRTTTWVADLVWRWALGGDPTRRNFKLQGEYLRQSQDGELSYALDGPASVDAFRAVRSGWYLQGVYQFAPRWRAGLRVDRLARGSVDFGDNAATMAAPAYDPRRHSVMVEYSPSEFSRFRVQFARDESRQGRPDSQLFLQYQTSLGAHGAHRF